MTKKKENKIYLDFLKLFNNIEFKDLQLPKNKNVTTKIKIWNLKRVFYFIYLFNKYEKIFKNSNRSMGFSLD